MSDYTYAAGLAAKDALPSGNAGKVISGAGLETEFVNIETAVATKYDSTDLGVIVQGYDAQLDILTGMTTQQATDIAALSTFMGTVLDDIDAATAQATLGINITGAVLPFAMNSAPTGWLAADGSVVSQTTYAALYAAITTTYDTGGEGAGNFRLPDLRGYFVRGAGTNSDGTVSGTFGAKQADAFQAHQHNTNASTGAGSVVSMPPAAAAGSRQDPTSGYLTDGANGTPRTANETRPSNIAMLYCIKT